MEWWQFIKLSNMQISLNLLFKEAYEASSELQTKLENIYPIECNIYFSNLSVISLSLTKTEQVLDCKPATQPQFSLFLNSATALHALLHSNIPSDVYEGDSELALLFLLAIKDSNLDIEVLIYKHLGTIPALIIRKLQNNDMANYQFKNIDSKIWQLQATFRAMAIRLDRLEMTTSS